MLRQFKHAKKVGNRQSAAQPYSRLRQETKIRLEIQAAPIFLATLLAPARFSLLLSSHSKHRHHHTAKHPSVSLCNQMAQLVRRFLRGDDAMKTHDQAVG